MEGDQPDRVEVSPDYSLFRRDNIDAYRQSEDPAGNSPDKEGPNNTLFQVDLDDLVAKACDAYANVIFVTGSAWRPWPKDLKDSENQTEEHLVTGSPSWRNDGTHSNAEASHEVGGHNGNDEINTNVNVDLNDDVNSPPLGHQNSNSQHSPDLTPAGDANVATGSALPEETSSNQIIDNSPGNTSRSREQRVIQPLVRFSPAYKKVWRPHGNKTLEMKLCRLLLCPASDLSNDTVVLQCDEVCAQIPSAAAVVAPEFNLDIAYVSVLYTKVWASKWNGHNRKIMFAQQKDHVRPCLCCQSVGGLCPLSQTICLLLSKIQIITFVPFIQLAALKDSNENTPDLQELSSSNDKRINAVCGITLIQLDILPLILCNYVYVVCCNWSILFSLISFYLRLLFHIFIPVYENSQWWAAVFSFNRQEIRVMDPTGRSSNSLQESISKLGQ